MKKTIMICGMILTALTLVACATKNTATPAGDTTYKSTTVHDYKGERG